jgi:hypothetical protein
MIPEGSIFYFNKYSVNILAALCETSGTVHPVFGTIWNSLSAFVLRDFGF